MLQQHCNAGLLGQIQLAYISNINKGEKAIWLLLATLNVTRVQKHTKFCELGILLKL